MKLSLSVLVCALLKLCVAPFFDRIPPINETTKTCLVTGASAGIGRELVKEMAARNWHVIGVARNEKKLNNLKAELGSCFTPCVCDVSDQNQVIAVSKKIKKQNLKPTLFFLNAGVGYRETQFEPVMEKHKTMFGVNYFGVVSWIDEWLQEVQAHGGGTFIATSSVTSLFADPGASGYSATKAALNNCFQALRLRYRKDNIGFVVALPGPVSTDMLKIERPFTHSPSSDARYIIKELLKRKKQIEPSWFYSCVCRMLHLLPDSLTGFLVRKQIS